MNNPKECKHKLHTGDRFITNNNFGTDNQKKDNLKSYCKECCKKQYSQYYRDNKETVLKQSAEYYATNIQVEQKRRKEHYERNPDYFKQYRKDNSEKNKKFQALYREQHKEERASYAREYYKKYYPANKHKYIQYVANRRAAKLKATPKWYEMIRVQKLYEQCANITTKTGIEHNVDHIIPLQHPLVCGLHCSDNLQIITKMENLEKGNKLTQR